MSTRRQFSIATLSTLTLASMPAWADEYSSAIADFKKAEETGKFFANAHGYAVFPKVGKAGIGIGGAHGKGRVYEKGKHIGDSTMNQLTVGFQFGAESFSQIVFFENAAALKRFTEGEFEFGAQVSAVVITLAAGAKVGSGGAAAGASVDRDKAKVVGAYNNGMAIFTIVQGGLMYEMTLGGQKFKFTKR